MTGLFADVKIVSVNILLFHLQEKDKNKFRKQTFKAVI